MSDKISLLLVNATFIILIAASALTWAVVIAKLWQLFRLGRQVTQFERQFDKFTSLPSAAQVASAVGPSARIAQVGVDSWHESAHDRVGREPGIEVRRDLLERNLRQQLHREKRVSETGLAVLASIGSLSPFVGLFGTVLGIIHALTSISASNSASLEVVAGPIGEALVATAVGIGVAVPAVLAYNYFTKRARAFVGDLEEFANQLVGTAVKSAINVVSAPRLHKVEDDVTLAQEVSV
jgi:biopolymer transport protein ExbB